MKQYPAFLKYKKYHRLSIINYYLTEKKIFYPLNGDIALQSIESGKINFKQIESCRRTIKRGLKKTGFVWIKLFTNVPIYKKSLASRMGKGKGNLSHWVAPVKIGTILFEISGLSFIKAKYILNKSRSKLPLKTKISKLLY